MQRYHSTPSIKHHLTWFALVMVGLLSLTILSDTAAQGNPTTITAFQTTATTVSRQTLADGTARIPVTWSVSNRPITANLYFEQYMPQTNEFFNVELPRPWTWVNSAGDGIVAPLLPSISGDTVELRLRVVSWLNGTVLTESSITLPIVDVEPTITEYTSLSDSVPASLLQSRAASVPVRWTVAHRPADTNLVFEQIMPGGAVRNVEFPRADPFVSSTGIGALNPYYPGATVDQLRFQLRLVNLLTNATVDSVEITLDMDNQPVTPRISRFMSPSVAVSRSALINGTANIPVSWTALNRPTNSNLYFEQILTNGNSVNVEFPRTDPYVSSIGNGAVRPVLPGGNADRVQLRVRLADLTTGATLATDSLFLNIVNDTNVANLSVTPLIAQPGALLEVAWDVPNTDRVRINWQYQQNGGTVNEPINGLDGDLQASGQTTLQIPTTISNDTITFTITEPTNTASPVTVSIGDVQVNDFTVTPATAQPGDTVEISWQTYGTPAITLWMESPGWTGARLVPGTDNPPLTNQGVTSVQIPDDAATTVNFQLRPANTQQTIAVEIVTLVKDCTYPWLADLDQGDVCADTAPNSAQAAYQPFEGGFMIWRDGKIWVFDNYGTHPVVIDTYTGGPVVWSETPPDGLYQPINGFGTAWVNNDAIREGIGWATAPEQSYIMSYHSGPTTLNGVQGRVFTFTLPDDRAVRVFEGGGLITSWTVGS